MADQLTPEQIARVQETFSLFDKDGDGSISLRDIGPVLRSLGYNPADSDVHKLMEKCDPEDTGAIEFSEFLTLLPDVPRYGETEDEVEEAFRVFDREGNGFLSAPELRHIMCNLGEKLTDEEVDEMIACADADAQGEINYKDFIQMLLSDKEGAL